MIPAGYPAEWETHAVLGDGATVELRPIRPSDRDALAAFHERQSAESIYFRFFQHRPKLSSRELDFFTNVDYVDRMAFVALVGGELVAVARYEKGESNDEPEVAFFVDDNHHGRGLATLMLEYLAAAARSQGYDTLTASVLPENYAMLGVFRKAGFAAKTRFDGGVIGVEVNIAVSAETIDAIAARRSKARSRSVARLLRPRSVAVVGAGRRPGSVGNELLGQIVDGGYTGTVHAVNPSATEVRGLPAVPSLGAIGEPVDLVIVAVPKAAVAGVVAEAATLGCGGLVIVSAGFADADAEGWREQRRLVSVARDHGMRLVGPNSFGLVNTDPEVSLHALFLDVAAERGTVGVLSQSGTLGGGVLELLRNRRLGISSFLAVGNRADVSVNDVLDYWLADEATAMVLLYVENYGNLRTFTHTARSLAAVKPVVTIRPPEDDLVELLRQSGVLQVDGVGEMAEVARVLDTQPLPGGSRVVVVSNAASIARLAVAACRRQGLDVVVPASVPSVAPNAIVGSLDAVLVGDVDSSAAVGTDDGVDDEQVLVAAAVSAEVDAVLIVMVPNLDLPPDELAGLLDRVNRSIDKPVVAVGLVGERRLRVSGLPVFEFPEEGARALGRLADYARWRRQNEERPAPFDDERHIEVAERIGPVVRALLPGAGAEGAGGEGAGGGRSLTMADEELAEVAAVLDLPIARWSLVRSVDDLEAAADHVGFPIVLKAGRYGERRTVGEAGGAAIDLYDLGQLRSAFRRMLARQGAENFLPAVVQAMIPSTANVKIDVVQDPDRGAMIRVGVGGAVGGRLQPLCRRFLPLGPADRRDLVDALAAAVTLGPESRSVIDRILVRVALVAESVPELARISLDPVLVGGSATAVGDLAVELRPWRHSPLDDVRRL